MFTVSQSVGSLLRGGVLIASAAMMALTPAMANAASTHQSSQHAPAAAPCMPAGHGPNDIPAITFGRNGGNIRPMQVAIYGDGAIAYQGVTPLIPNYSIAPLAVLGLQHLAQAEGFASMPPLTTGPGFLPDFATLYVTMRNGCDTSVKTVRVRGRLSGGFAELFATLTAASGLPATQSPAIPQPQSTPPAIVPGPQAITLANDGQTLQYVVGQRFLLDLGSGYQWSLSLSTQGVFERIKNIAVVNGAQGIYVAKMSGQVTLSATGDPLCLSAKPACTTPSRSFRVQLVVHPSM